MAAAIIPLFAGLIAGDTFAQTELINGGENEGQISVPHGTQTWTVTAEQGEWIILRARPLTGTMSPSLALYNPAGQYVGGGGWNSLGPEVAHRAAAAGTYSVIVSDGSGPRGQTGTYLIRLAKIPAAFVIPEGDEGGPLINGENQSATITPADIDRWTFDAAAGDRLLLRVQRVNGLNSFSPSIRLFGPDGAYIVQSPWNSLNPEISYTATMTGRYTVVVTDNSNYGVGSGDYTLRLLKVPGGFVIPEGDQGGELASGENKVGLVEPADIDPWTFEANAGDRILLRVGRVSGTNSFNPKVELYGPNGIYLAQSPWNSLGPEISLTATNSGTFTAVVSDSSHYGVGSGDYVLRLARIPAEFVVPEEDEGGELTNGADHRGLIHPADIDLWSFQADAGDQLILKVALTTSTNSFSPTVRLFGPGGQFLGGAPWNSLGPEIARTATVSGTYFAVVTDQSFYGVGSGEYVVRLAIIPGAFVVSEGDEGGLLADDATESGSIERGDIDLWSFQADAGDSLLLGLNRLTTTNGFSPSIRVYGPSGQFLREILPSTPSPGLSFAATASGLHTLVITDRSFYGVGTGTYSLRFLRGRPPLIFIPGIAGSRLIGGGHTGANGNGSYLWLTVRPDKIDDLDLNEGAPDVQAVAVLESYDVAEDFVIGLGEKGRSQFYGPFLNHLRTHGYVDFDLAEDPTRLTSTYMLDQSWLRTPTLFTFPYDWRLRNESHTETLKAYIDRIRQLHGGVKVNVVAHSMGGLLLRRFMLDYGTSDLNTVVTVGSPLWGAPQGIFRLLTGTFYGPGKKSLIDWINKDSIKKTLWSHPAVAELLPSTYYQLNGGALLFSELGWDFNRNGDAHEIYDPLDYIRMMSAQATLRGSPFNPIVVNNAFHTVGQSDWSGIPANLPILHITGHQRNYSIFETTTISMIARSGAWWTSLNPGGVNSTILDYHRIDPVYGPGDGTVPLLSARRFPAYHSPNTTVHTVTGGEEAGHMEMLSLNSNVWAMIDDFLSDGELSEASPSLRSGALQSSEPEPEVDAISILVKGRSFVHVRNDLGSENAKLSDIAALKVPNVDVGYAENSVLVEFVSEVGVTISNAAESHELGPVEIEFVRRDRDDTLVELRRYRFNPESFAWQLEFSPQDSARLMIDADEDNLFEAEEAVTPTHNGSGASADLTSPVIILEIANAGPGLSVLLSGSDDSGTEPFLYYSVNGGPVTRYDSPVNMAVSGSDSVRAFAEDPMGNTSGVIETRVAPVLSTRREGASVITITWPIAEAYILEEARTANGEWNASEASIVRDGMLERAEIVVDESAAFFRLRAAPKMK